METTKKTPIKVINEKNIIEHRGQWFTLLQLSEKHLKENPEDAYLIGKQYKILNRVFMVQSVTGKVNVIYFGAKCQFRNSEPKTAIIVEPSKIL